MTVKEITFRINQLQTQYLYIIITIKLLLDILLVKMDLAHHYNIVIAFRDQSVTRRTVRLRNLKTQLYF